MAAGDDQSARFPQDRPPSHSLNSNARQLEIPSTLESRSDVPWPATSNRAFSTFTNPPLADSERAHALPHNPLDPPWRGLEILALAAEMVRPSLSDAEKLFIIVDCEKRGYKESYTRQLVSNIRTRGDYQFSQQSGIDQTQWTRLGLPGATGKIEHINQDASEATRESETKQDVIYEPEDLQSDGDTEMDKNVIPPSEPDRNVPSGKRVLYRSNNLHRVGAKRVCARPSRDAGTRQQDPVQREEKLADQPPDELTAPWQNDSDSPRRYSLSNTSLLTDSPKEHEAITPEVEEPVIIFDIKSHNLKGLGDG
ncbi:hypothetical protein PVAG01_01387 [Phlyctema vagabunda]|uniref:Uncharacterized protein n=1 Tax=Phlyctema vagabunda TaxID=108571 RepID=A0ABR4PWZ7_9HELO